MPFTITPSERIPAVLEIGTRVFGDGRGAVMEFYDREVFAKAGIRDAIQLGVTSVSQQGTLRGLHIQARPHRQGKIIQCLVGEIFDVIVDLRPGSPTYGEHVSMTLDDRRFGAVFAPRGFAHGFYVTRGPAVVHYLLDHPYVPTAETGLRWDDPDLKIAWPLGVQPIVSGKDQALPTLRNYRAEASA